MLNRNIEEIAMIATRESKRIYAFLILTLPFAIGRCFFVGCFLSLSTSRRSFRIYTQEAVRQNKTGLKTESQSAFDSKTLPLNMSAANIKMFLIQCFGRISFM